MPAVTPTSVGAVDTPDVLPVDQAAAIAATQSYAQQSLDARDLALNWATKTSGEVVIGQGYGAKKYAQDAAAAVVEAQGDLDASVALAHDWATKTFAEVVAGQGYGAKKYAADSAAALQSFLEKYVGAFSSAPSYVGGSPPWVTGALYWNTLSGKFKVWQSGAWVDYDATAQAAKNDAETAAGLAATISAGLSANDYTLDGNDAQTIGAIFSAPKGLFMLDGARVALSSLLSFSSGPKYTRGPDGNYVLNAANGPAWDWDPVTGQRRLLVEAIGATNAWLNSEAPDASTIDTSAWTIANSANSLFGNLNRCTITAKLATPQIGAAMFVVNAGDVITMTIALKNGTGQWYLGGLYGSSSAWGANADATCVVISGPGTVSHATGGAWDISGTSSDTVIRWTRTYQTSETAYALAYSNCSVGQTVSFGRPQVERGYGSSYTPCGSSPTARAPDVVTAASGLLALLTAANAALSFRGTILGNPSTAWGSICGNSASLSASASGVVAYDGGSIHSLPRTPGAAVDGGMTIGACASYTSGKRKVALNGSAVATDNYSLFTNADSPFYFAYGPSGALNLLIDEIVVWPILASDAGLQAQARVYS